MALQIYYEASDLLNDVETPIYFKYSLAVPTRHSAPISTRSVNRFSAALAPLTLETHFFTEHDYNICVPFLDELWSLCTASKESMSN